MSSFQYPLKIDHYMYTQLTDLNAPKILCWGAIAGWLLGQKITRSKNAFLYQCAKDRSESP